MKNFTLFFLSLGILFLTACNQDQKDVKILNPYTKVPTGYSSDAPKLKAPRGEDQENQILLAKMKSQEILEIAKIEAESNAEIKRIEAQLLQLRIEAEKEAKLNEQKTKKDISTVQYQTQKDIADSSQKVALQTQEKDLYLYRIIIGVVALLVFIITLLVYFSNRKNKAVELKIQEDKIKHEQYMQASEQHHQKASKMLDIIANEKSDKHVKKELIRILRYQDQNQALIPTSIVEEDEKEDEDETKTN